MRKCEKKTFVPSCVRLAIQLTDCLLLLLLPLPSFLFFRCIYSFLCFFFLSLLLLHIISFCSSAQPVFHRITFISDYYEWGRLECPGIEKKKIIAALMDHNNSIYYCCKVFIPEKRKTSSQFPFVYRFK